MARPLSPRYLILKNTYLQYWLQVESGTGADGSGSRTSYHGDITYQGLSASYKAYSVYNAGDPSICEVYFYVANQQVSFFVFCRFLFVCNNMYFIQVDLTNSGF